QFFLYGHTMNVDFKKYESFKVQIFALFLYAKIALF
ncbi:hypothetical protein A5875_002162, partial [Enterococcus sp. 3H8_DIV0648]